MRSEVSQRTIATAGRYNHTHLVWISVCCCSPRKRTNPVVLFVCVVVFVCAHVCVCVFVHTPARLLTLLLVTEPRLEKNNSGIFQNYASSEPFPNVLRVLQSHVFPGVSQQAAALGQHRLTRTCVTERLSVSSNERLAWKDPPLPPCVAARETCLEFSGRPTALHTIWREWATGRPTHRNLFQTWSLFGKSSGVSPPSWELWIYNLGKSGAGLQVGLVMHALTKKHTHARARTRARTHAHAHK